MAAVSDDEPESVGEVDVDEDDEELGAEACNGTDKCSAETEADDEQQSSASCCFLSSAISFST